MFVYNVKKDMNSETTFVLLINQRIQLVFLLMTKIPFFASKEMDQKMTLVYKMLNVMNVEVNFNNIV